MRPGHWAMALKVGKSAPRSQEMPQDVEEKLQMKPSHKWI